MFNSILMALFLSAVSIIPGITTIPIRQAVKPCETLAPVKLSPTEAPAMVQVLVSSSVTNCSPLNKTYRVIGGQVAACGQRLVFADGNIPLAPGEKIAIKAATVSAPDDCPGPVEVIIVAFDGEAVIAQVKAIIKSN